MKGRLDVHDAREANQPNLCSEYVEEVFDHLKSIELNHLPRPGYMT